MKQIIAIIGATLLFLGVSIYSHSYLKRSADNITEHLDKIEAYSKNQDWPKADEELRVSKTEWDQMKDSWSVLIDHIEIDSINSSISRVDKYVDAKSLPDILAESSNLKLLIEHIPETDKLSIKNIF